MSKVSVRPNSGTLTGGWAVTGGGTAHAALADDNPATYISHNGAHGVATIGFPAAAVPPGARLGATYLRLVTSTDAAGQSGLLKPVLMSVGGTMVAGAQTVNWPGRQSTDVVVSRDPSGVPHSFALTPPGPVRIYEATAWQVFVAQPLVSTLTLQSSATTESRMRVTWTSDLDSSGGQVVRHAVRARVGGSTELEFEGDGDPGRFEFPDLPNATYSVQVRVAQWVRGSLFWSPWKSLAVTLNAPRPGVPDLSLLGENNLAYVSLALTEQAGAASTHWWEIESSPDGVSGWQPIFTALGDGRVENPDVGGPGEEIVADFEAANDVLRFYRVRAVHDHGGGELAASAWCAVESAKWRHSLWWIKSPRFPGWNVAVEIASQPGYERPGRDGRFQGLGSPEVIVISDLPGPPQGEITLFVESSADRVKLDKLIESMEPVLVQAAPGSFWTDRWVRLTNLSRTLPVDKTLVTDSLDRFEWVEIPRPY